MNELLSHTSLEKLGRPTKGDDTVKELAFQDVLLQDAELCEITYLHDQRQVYVSLDCIKQGKTTDGSFIC